MLKYYNDFKAYVQKNLGMDASASDAEIHQAALDELEPTANNTSQNTTTDMNNLDEMKSLLVAQKADTDKQLAAIFTHIGEQNATIKQLQGNLEEVAKNPNASVSDAPKGVVSAQRDADVPLWAKEELNKELVERIQAKGYHPSEWDVVNGKPYAKFQR